MRAHLRMSEKSSTFGRRLPYGHSPESTVASCRTYTTRAFFAKPNGFPCCIGL